MVDQINGLIGKIPGNVIPKMDLSKMQIGTIDPSVVDNAVNLPRIPTFGGTAQPNFSNHRCESKFYLDWWQFERLRNNLLLALLQRYC